MHFCDYCPLVATLLCVCLRMPPRAPLFPSAVEQSVTMETRAIQIPNWRTVTEVCAHACTAQSRFLHTHTPRSPSQSFYSRRLWLKRHHLGAGFRDTLQSRRRLSARAVTGSGGCGSRDVGLRYRAEPSRTEPQREGAGADARGGETRPAVVSWKSATSLDQKPIQSDV